MHAQHSRVSFASAAAQERPQGGHQGLSKPGSCKWTGRQLEAQRLRPTFMAFRTESAQQACGSLSPRGCLPLQSLVKAMAQECPRVFMLRRRCPHDRDNTNPVQRHNGCISLVSFSTWGVTAGLQSLRLRGCATLQSLPRRRGAGAPVGRTHDTAGAWTMDTRGALARGTMATAAMMTGKRTDATPPAGLHLPYPFMGILGRPQEPMQQDLSLLLEAVQCSYIMAARRGCCSLRHGSHKADREVRHGAFGTSVVCEVTTKQVRQSASVQVRGQQGWNF